MLQPSPRKSHADSAPAVIDFPQCPASCFPRRPSRAAGHIPPIAPAGRAGQLDPCSGLRTSATMLCVDLQAGRRSWTLPFGAICDHPAVHRGVHHVGDPRCAVLLPSKDCGSLEGKLREVSPKVQGVFRTVNQALTPGERQDLRAVHCRQRRKRSGPGHCGGEQPPSTGDERCDREFRNTAILLGGSIGAVVGAPLAGPMCASKKPKLPVRRAWRTSTGDDAGAAPATSSRSVWPCLGLMRQFDDLFKPK